VRVDAETLEVDLPHELHAEQARLELDLYLRVWQSLHEWSAVDTSRSRRPRTLVVGGYQ
jgi:hypothetical protein